MSHIRIATAATPYKELQKEAKRCGIPANMKRSFLESAIAAFSENDHEKLASIIQHHKGQRKRPNNKKSVKTFARSETKSSKGSVSKTTIAVATSPVQASSSNYSSHGRFYVLSNDNDDDDDSSNDFHPDSTSTPNRSSPAANLSRYADNYGVGTSPGVQHQTNQIRSLCDSSASSTAVAAARTVTALALAKVQTQELRLNDINENRMSMMHKTTAHLNSVSSLKLPSTPSQPIACDVDSTSIHFTTTAAAATEQNQYSFQTKYSNFHRLQINSNVAAAPPVPGSTPFNQHPAVGDFGYPSYSPLIMEKQYATSASSSYGGVSNTVQLSDVTKNFLVPPTPVAAPEKTATTLSSSSAYVKNSRTLAVTSSSTANLNQRRDINDKFNRPVLMPIATSVNTEFDSDSDSETLSLTEEIVNFLDPRVETRRLSVPAPNVQRFHSTPINSNESLSSLPNQNRSVCGNSRCRDNCFKKPSFQDCGANVSAALQHQSSSSIAAVDGYDSSLPSITTLLPEFKMQAFCQGFSESSMSYYDFTAQSYNAYSHANRTADPTAAFVSPLPLPKRTQHSNPPYAFGGDPSVSDMSQFAAAAAGADSAAKDPNVFMGFPYRSICGTNSGRSNDSNGVLESFSHSHLEQPQPQTQADSALDLSVSSTEMDESPVSLKFNSPFDVFNEAIEEMRRCTSNANTIETPSLNYLPSTTNNSAAATATTTTTTTCETWLQQQTETISVEDVNRESFENKMYGAVEKNHTGLMAIENRPSLALASTSSTRHTDSETKHESPVPSYRPCKNEIYGCNVIMNDGESARQHENQCLHQVVHCPSEECNWCGVMKTLTDHIYVSHKSDLHISNDFVYVMNQNERDAPFATYFQLHEGTIFVITLHMNQKKCIVTMQYLPEIETADYRNQCVKGTIQLVYFTSKVETKCWKGVVRPYFENDKSLYKESNILQSAIGSSKNVVVRVLID
ncbi:uncharacterized protein LOC135838720 isoform X1 [Planococcus citri]|uniref:uncharacterized protein LOC135838720 isoform X1 n=1 Tax=Planococcus citri TaxID=170843 RepID=UPI0031F73695